MRDMINLAGTSSLGVLVYLGAGTAEDLEPWLQAGIERAVLVEPNPGLSRRLEVQASDRIAVLPLAVGGQAGVQDFYLFNAAVHSSLRKPTGLKDLFPGLRRTGVTQVDTLDMAGLMRQVNLPDEGAHVLIIDAAGEEQTVVQGLIEAEVLSRFDHIILRGADMPLYEGAVAIDEIVPSLEKAGYSVRARTDAVADFPQVYLWRDALKVENTELKAQLAADEARIAELETAHAAQQARAVKAEGAWRDVKNRLDAHLAQAEETAVAHAAQKSRAEDAEKALAAAQEALKDHAAKADRLSEKLTVAEARIVDLEAACEAQELRAVKAEGAWSDVKSRLEAQKAETEALESQLQSRTKALKSKDSDLGVALRSQAVMQADLLSLRQKYEVLRSEKAEQEALLVQVTSRLSAAANYLHVLKAPETAAAAQLAAPDDTPTPAKTARKPRSTTGQSGGQSKGKTTKTTARKSTRAQPKGSGKA
jgi:hypothetical protein